MLLLYPSKQVLLIRDSCQYRWRRLNPEKAKESDLKKSIKYKKEHSDRVKKTQKKYSIKKLKINPNYYKESYKKRNKQKKRDTENKYRHNNKEKIHEIQKKSYKKSYIKSPDKWKERRRKFEHTPHGKLYRAKVCDERRRNLGSEMLNEWFKGCNRHHINKNQIVCIPAEIHKAHPHNHKKPETMEVINRIAMQYLFNCKA